MTASKDTTTGVHSNRMPTDRGSGHSEGVEYNPRVHTPIHTPLSEHAGIHPHGQTNMSKNNITFRATLPSATRKSRRPPNGVILKIISSFWADIRHICENLIYVDYPCATSNCFHLSCTYYWNTREWKPTVSINFPSANNRHHAEQWQIQIGF